MVTVRVRDVPFSFHQDISLRLRLLPFLETGPPIIERECYLPGIKRQLFRLCILSLIGNSQERLYDQLSESRKPTRPAQHILTILGDFCQDFLCAMAGVVVK